MEKTLHSLVLPAGSLAIYKNWGRTQLLMIAEETINFMNRILKCVEWQMTHVKERIIEQRFEFNSFYMKVYNEECRTEHLLMANGIDWSDFQNFSEKDDPMNNQLKRLKFNFRSCGSAKSEDNYDYFEMVIPKEKLESVKKAALRLVEIAIEEKHCALVA